MGEGEVGGEGLAAGRDVRPARGGAFGREFIVRVLGGGGREFGIKGARAQGGLRGEVGRDGEVWHGLASVRVLTKRYGRGCDQAGPHGAPGWRAPAPEVLMPGYPVRLPVGLT